MATFYKLFSSHVGDTPPNLPRLMADGKFWASNNENDNETEDMSIDDDSNLNLKEREDIMSSKLYERLQEDIYPKIAGTLLRKDRTQTIKVLQKKRRKPVQIFPQKIQQSSQKKPWLLVLRHHPTKGFKYIKSDSGPYKVIVALKSTNTQGESTKPPSVVEVSSFLVKCGIRFSLLENISRYKWVAIFDNKNNANKTLDNKYILESKYSVMIPWYMLYRKMIIKGMPRYLRGGIVVRNQIEQPRLYLR